MNRNSSIHPRVENNHQVHDKVNTSKPPKRTKGIRARRLKDLNRRQVAFNSMKNTSGHKMPGSMKG